MTRDQERLAAAVREARAAVPGMRDETLRRIHDLLERILDGERLDPRALAELEGLLPERREG